MSREQHVEAIHRALNDIRALTMTLSRIDHYEHRVAAASAIGAVGLPADTEAPGGQVVVSLTVVKEHLAFALAACAQAEQALTEYSRRV